MRTFIGFGQVPYIGQPQAQAIKLGGIASVAVPLLFQWLSYGASTLVPNINVLVDLSTQPCVKLDQIRSVYIDNLGSDNPIYVFFPDTGYTIVAKPNSEGWYPAYTNARKIWIIGEGFLTGDIPQTWILLSNIFLPPSVNTEIDNAVALWKASPVITRGSTIFNSALGIPALGDQTQQYLLNVNSAANNTLPVFGSPFASGFITLTSISFSLRTATVNANLNADVVLESTGISGILYDWRFALVGGATFAPGVLPIYSQSGLQIKLDATQTWRLRNPVQLTNGEANVIASYTVGPN